MGIRPPPSVALSRAKEELPSRSTLRSLSSSLSQVTVDEMRKVAVAGVLSTADASTPDPGRGRLKDVSNLEYISYLILEYICNFIFEIMAHLVSAVSQLTRAKFDFSQKVLLFFIHPELLRQF